MKEQIWTSKYFT